MLSQISFLQVPLLPQPLYIKRGASTAIILAKILDEILIADNPEDTDDIIVPIIIKFKLGTIVHGPALLRFFGLNMMQHENFSKSVEGDEKILNIEAIKISRTRCRCSTTDNVIQTGRTH